MKLSVVVGTRPQLIKISPLIRRIEKDRDISLQFIDTGQHYDHELNQTFYEELRLPDSTFLDVGSAAPGEQTGKALIAIEEQLAAGKPDAVLVIGDTNSTLAGALAAAKLHAPVGHIEAGLRSFDRRMPEEVNRIIVDHVADWLYAPTKNAEENLRKEGIAEDKIVFTGDITVDACTENYRIAEKRSKILEETKVKRGNYILLTAHRQENVDDEASLKKIVEVTGALDKEIIFPLHPRTKKNMQKFGLLRKLEKNCTVTKPLGYFDFLMLLSNAACVVTDSGGVQKEALILKTPCITMRTTTEWPETIKLKGNALTGLDARKIASEARRMSTKEFAAAMKKIKNPYGDGKASARILAHIKDIKQKK